LTLALLAGNFSHELHLKLQPDCNACHATARTSTRLDDNNLPDPKKACSPCHKDVSVKAPAKTFLSSFNHQLHSKLGNIAPVIAKAIDTGAYLSPPGDIRKHLGTKNACIACHRQPDVPEASMPRMADCLVCHSEVEPPFSCTKCHAEDAQLKPATHTPDFLDSHTRKDAKLDKPSCAVCHGRTFTCLGCH
jgi:hypothetical protein